ncbi:MAG: hypothetical protein LBR21_00580 [Propionibacteriaceae bacterium]|nr:hypothetical protein [Propionibacteriaceae bacterium]
MKRALSLLSGLLALALIASAPITAASFTDTEAGKMAIAFDDPLLDLEPLDTMAMGTAMALDQFGCLWIWGLRKYGMAGVGVETVASEDPASRVCLPDSRKIVTADATSQYGQNYDLTYGAAALADDGTVWTWGCYYLRLCGVGAADKDNSAGDTQYYSPQQVTFPNLASGEKIVDLKALNNAFAALSSGGQLFTWGEATFGVLGNGTQGTNLTSPVRMLTQVHSFGTSIFCGWAIAAAGWRSGKDAASNDTLSSNKAAVVFWGSNAGSYGRPSGDTSIADTVVKSTPSALTGTLANYLDYKDGDSTLGANTDDNATLGVRMGSAQDGGTFQDMTGQYYGSSIRLKNGSLLSWGYGSHGASGAGISKTGGKPALITAANPIVGLATGTEFIFYWDSAGQAYFYGERKHTDKFPREDGAPYELPNVANLAFAIDGGTTYPAWQKGKIAKIVGFGDSAMVKRTDGLLFTVGGGREQIPSGNPYSIVRDYLLKTSTTNTSVGQPATLLDTWSR